MCKESALLKSNENLIYKLASPFLKAAPHLHDDLLAAANIGFLNAIRHCETDNTYAVSTIATRMIQNECTNLLDIERAVHIPKDRVANARKLRRAKSKSAEEYHAVLSELNITETTAKTLAAEQVCNSLNEVVHTSESENNFAVEVQDLIADERATPEAKLIAENLSFDIRNFIAATDILTETEREHLSLYYGLDGLNESRTLELVGALASTAVTKQRVMQTLNKSHAKLLPAAVSRGWR